MLYHFINVQVNKNVSISLSGVALRTFEPPEGCNCVQNNETEDCLKGTEARCGFWQDTDYHWCYVDETCPDIEDDDACHPWARCQG